MEKLKSNKVKSVQSNYDVIIIGQQPWDTEIGSNCKNIAIEFSKTNRVLYVNSPLDRITAYREKNDVRTIRRRRVIKNLETGLVKINDNLWNLTPNCMVESINWLNNDFLFNTINKFNNKKFARAINNAIVSLKFENYILFNDNEMFKGFYLASFLAPKLSIYYSRDFMLGVPYWKKHGQKLEPLLIQKSNLCFANSNYLAAYCKQFNNNSYYVGQGCDLDDFMGVIKTPLDVINFNKPTIGYVGALNSSRLDIDVIVHIAKTYTNCQIVLVGPEDEVFKKSELHNVENVTFLGQKPLVELPQYINSFNVCINPQLVNDLTIGNYPRKIDEYLALGKPVVASATKTMEVFADYLYLANTKEEYISHIASALQENNNELVAKRKNIAASHTWENSVNLMRAKIDFFFTRSQKPQIN